jgi:hypothetical protein
MQSKFLKQRLKYKSHIRTTRGIANKGFSGLRSSVVRFNFSNGGQERSPQSLTSHTAETLFVIKAESQDLDVTKIHMKSSYK